MKLSKKQLALIALVIVLVISNIAFAVLYMTRDVTITGGVSTVGSIEVYEDDGMTVLTSIDFPNFTGGVPSGNYENFFINNTGNQPVYVYWNISSSSVAWSESGLGLIHTEGGPIKYYFRLRNATLDYWLPNTQARIIEVGQAIYEEVAWTYTGNPNTAESLSLTVTFYAEDA